MFGQQVGRVWASMNGMARVSESMDALSETMDIMCLFMFFIILNNTNNNC